MWRPAKLGRDPEYALSDPGHEFIPDLTETWLGPLAARLGIEGQRATLEQRQNLYARRSPDGATVLLPVVSDLDYRPVHGGSFHAPNSLRAWMAEQAEPKRKQAERLLLECATQVVRESLLPDLVSRVGKGGTRRVPAETLAVAFQHLTDARGGYLPHVQVEIHNLGRTADGKMRALDNASLFYHQRLYSLEWDAKLVCRFYEVFGLVLRPGLKGLEVKGLEALRGVKTPRQEEMDGELKEKGWTSTPKTRHWAAAKTHRPRDEKLTVKEAIERTRVWLRAKGIDVRNAFVAACRKTSELYEQRKAEAALRAAAKAVSLIGCHVTSAQLSSIALREGLARRVPPERIHAVVDAAKQEPRRFGLARLENGQFTTLKVEISRAIWSKALAKLERKRPRPPKKLVDHKLDLGSQPPGVHERAAAKSLYRRVARLTEPTAGLRTCVQAYQADNRRVFVVAGERSAQQTREVTRLPVSSPEQFAARLGKTPLKQTFLALRKHRWVSHKQIKALVKKIRQPQLRLERGDVLVLDARHASHHALRSITSKARKAKATVLLIEDPAVSYERNRVLTRKSHNPER